MRPALQRKLQPKILRNSRILIISKSLTTVHGKDIGRHVQHQRIGLMGDQIDGMFIDYL